jgi:hypothetical protein
MINFIPAKLVSVNTAIDGIHGILYLIWSNLFLAKCGFPGYNDR